MLKKEWIRTNNSFMKILIFLIFKKEGKRPVIDYHKLNSIIVKNSMILSFIEDIMDQVYEIQ